jgi:hypothetical protein
VTVVWTVVTVVLTAKNARMRVNPNTNYNHGNNDKRYVFKTKYTRRASSHH